MGAAGRHLILYDGVCGLCNGTVRFVLKRDPFGLFHFAALGSDTANSMLRRFRCESSSIDTFYVIVEYRSDSPRILSRARAALFIVGQIGGFWGALSIFGILPDFLLNPLYDTVARYRYRVFGRYDQCPVPPPGFEGRFLEK